MVPAIYSMPTVRGLSICTNKSGASAARNAGVLAANCEWVAFLDHDDEWYPTKLACQAASVVIADISAVEEGQMFGTRFNGNYPLFNTGNSFRIGWQYFSETGQYFFRVNIGGVHIYLSPSWWF